MDRPFVPSWAVAAAILLIEGRPMCHRELTHEVMDLGLSRLGRRRGRSPWKTLRSILGDGKVTIFEATGEGYYQIRNKDAALRKYYVRTALKYLAKQKSVRYTSLLASYTDDLLDLRSDAADITAEFNRLNAQMRRITELYSPRRQSANV